MLVDNEERLVNKGTEEDWWVTSMPMLRYWLRVKHVNIIKLDCEGCEVRTFLFVCCNNVCIFPCFSFFLTFPCIMCDQHAFARDILREDPEFLFHVDQMSIETHVSKAWMTTREHLYYFGLHFALLEEAGFRMEWSQVFGCTKHHEDYGCLDEMYGFPCGFKPSRRHPKVARGYSCHDFLWKRY